MDERPLAVESAEGLELEACVVEPDEATRAIVLCHPHPQMGGTMNAPLLLALQERLVADRWAVLRFNFRGIGSSEGESGDGMPELGDARGALVAARDRWSGLPLAIAGWSFGAAVAIRVAADEDVAGCAAISPAVLPRPGVTAGVPGADRYEKRVPLLVVCGANDKQVTTADVRAWAEGVRADYVEVPGANHFFWAKYDQLGEIVAGWLDRTASG